MLVYATTDDLTAAPWSLTITPEQAGPQLRLASALVREATMTARYATDEDGAPAHAPIRAAFRDAVCAQVAAWTASGIDPQAGAAQVAAAPVASKRLGSAQIAYDTSGAASVTALAARARAATALCREAVLILRDAGLVVAAPETSR